MKIDEGKERDALPARERLIGQFEEALLAAAVLTVRLDRALSLMSLARADLLRLARVELRTGPTDGGYIYAPELWRLGERLSGMAKAAKVLSRSKGPETKGRPIPKVRLLIPGIPAASASEVIRYPLPGDEEHAGLADPRHPPRGSRDEDCRRRGRGCVQSFGREHQCRAELPPG